MKILIILFILFSCSHSESYNRHVTNQSISSSVDLFEKIPNKRRTYKINFQKLIIEIDNLAIKHKGLLTSTIIAQHDGEPIYRIDLPGNRDVKDKKKIIITSGIHGDESIAIGAMLDFISLIVNDPSYREDFDFTFFPYLNPNGIKRNSRYLKNGIDLNRTFKKGQEQIPTNIFKESVKEEVFDLALDLHEAHTKTGFFAIKVDKLDNSIAQKAIEKMPKDIIFSSPDGNYPYRVPNTKNPKKFSYTLLSPGETVSFNPGTLKGYFKTDLNARYAYTLEAPGKISLDKRLVNYVDFIKEMVNSYKLNK